MLKTGSVFPDLFLVWAALCCRRERQTDGTERSIKKRAPEKITEIFLKIFCICNNVTEKIHNSGYTVSINRNKFPKEEKNNGSRKDHGQQF